MLAIKRGIREAEAVSGIETFGMSRDQARFLNLPFYQTGKTRKDPIGPEDVRITLELLEEQQSVASIFVAGDLSDPHGTHRMCLETVQAALEQYSGEPAGDLVLSRRVAGVGRRRSRRAGAALGGRAALQDPGDLQASEPEGPRALPRPGRSRVLAARRGAKQEHRRGCRPLGLPEYFAMEAYRSCVANGRRSNRKRVANEFAGWKKSPSDREGRRTERAR